MRVVLGTIARIAVGALLVWAAAAKLRHREELPGWLRAYGIPAPVTSPLAAVLIVNGLGTVKYEELFVLYRYLTDLLADEGIEVVSPLCEATIT